MEVKKFVSMLNGDDPVAATLETFLSEMENNTNSSKYMNDILQETQNLDVICKLLDRDNLMKEEVVTIFDVLGSCLMSLPTDEEAEKTSLHVAQFLLQKHRKHLLNLLSPSSTDRGKIAVLKVITGLIVRNVVAAHEILLQLGLDRVDLVTLSKKKETRSYALYLVLAILSTGDFMCFRHLLSQPERVTCFFKDLLGDSSETIIKLLTLLRQLLLNSNVSKTVKTKIFTEDTCKFLTNLYFYEDRLGASYSSEEKSAIKNTLHQLMIPLCSHLKYGIIFEAKDKESEVIVNKHVYRILATIKYPWHFEEGRELIVSILNSCPDVYKLFREKIRDHRVPRDNVGFLTLCKLVILLIEHSQPWKELETKYQKDGSVKDFSFSIPLSFQRTVIDSLENSSASVRQCGLSILASYAQKAKEFLVKIEESTSLNAKLRRKLKDVIVKEVEKCDFGLNKLEALWHNYLKEEDVVLPKKWEKKRLSQFCTLVDVSHIIGLYIEIFGFKLVRKRFSPFNMLMKVNALTIKDVSIRYQLQINLLQLILKAQNLKEFDAFGFVKDVSETEETFINESFFTLLAEIYCSCCSSQASSESSTDELRLELKTLSLLLLNSSLECWGVSSYCENYIEIWLDKIEHNDRKECSELLSKIISKTVCNLYSYLDVMTAMNTEIEGNEASVPVNLVNMISQMDPTVQIEDNEDVNITAIKIPFSCLVLGALDSLKDKPDLKLMNYFMRVMDDYIHLIEHPRVLSKHLLDYNMVSSETKTYFEYWCGMEQPLSSSGVSDNTSLEASVSSEFKTIFMGGPIADCYSDMASRITTKSELFYIYRQIYAYIQHEYKVFQKSKEKKKLKFFIKIFKKLLKLAQEDSKELRHTFRQFMTHPFTLKRYEPFTSNIVQEIIDGILVVVLEKYSDLHLLLKPFIERFISSLQSSSIEEDKLTDYTIIYVDNYSLLNFDEVERLSVRLLHTPFLSENFISLLNKLFKLLKGNLHSVHQSCKEVTSLLLSKIIHMAKSKKISEEKLKIFRILSGYLKEFLSHLTPLQLEDYKNILRSRIYHDILVELLINADPSVLDTLVGTLNEIKIHLACQIPFILHLIKRKEYSNRPEIRSYLLRLKRPLLDLVSDPDNEMNEHYENLIDYMLSKDLFEQQEVVDLCNEFYKSEFDIPHVLSIVPFFDKMSKAINNNCIADTDPLHPYIQLLSILMREVIQKYRKTEEEHNFIERVRDVILNITKHIEPKFIRKEFYSSKLWQNFVRKVLKEALSDSKHGPKLLNSLSELARLVYSKRKKEESSVSPKVLYQMIRSHSQFLPLMLNHQSNEGLKEQLIFLQLALVEVCTDVCEERHIPLLMGSYGATMSKSDQYILKILFLYERKGQMPSIEPTLWGQAAVSHFALMQSDGMTGFKSPNVIHILPLIDFEKVIETSLNFNADLGLEPTTIVESDNPSLYDQRYLISLFVYFTTIDYLNVMKLVEKGMVAMGVAALSSHRDEVWAAGAKILHYIATSFNNSKFQNRKLQWMWMVGVLGYGLEAKQQRIPSIMVHFLVHASRLLLQPEDVMYGPVMNYLYLKPALSVFKVPELYNLFYSSDVQNHKEHRAFLFDLLASSIKDDLDIQLCKSMFVGKLILAVMKSPTVNTNLRVLSLNVLNAMVEVPRGARSLVLEQSLLEELPHALVPSLFCPLDKQKFWIESVVEVLTSLWKTWRTCELDREFAKTLEPGMKRKRDQNVRSKTNGDLSPKKKRKLSNGHYSMEDEQPEDNRITNKAQSGVVEIFKFLGCIFGKVICEGTFDSILNVFDILIDILTCLENFEEEKRYYKAPIISNNFARCQVKLWIENSDFVKRFGDYIEDDCVSLHNLATPSDLRFKPLRTSPSCEAIEQLKAVKTVIQKRKQLLEILN